MGQSSGIGRHGNSRDLRRVLRRQVIEAGNGVNRGEARARMQESKHICTAAVSATQTRREDRKRSCCRGHGSCFVLEFGLFWSPIMCRLCNGNCITARIVTRGKTTHSRYVVQNAACREICPSNRPVLGRGMTFGPLFPSWTCVVRRSDTRSSGNRVRAMHRRRLHGRA